MPRGPKPDPDHPDRRRAGQARRLGRAARRPPSAWPCAPASSWPPPTAGQHRHRRRPARHPARPSASGATGSSPRRLDGLADEPRPGAPRTITDAQVEQVVTRTLETKPDGRHPLEHPRHGPRRGPVADRRRPHLAGVRAQAAPARDVQALDRPVLRREGPRRRRAVPGPAGAGHRAVRGREEPGAGPGPHPAGRCRCCPGRAEKATHDYVRHGTTSLFAALDVATGRGDRHSATGGTGTRSSWSSSTTSTRRCAREPGVAVHVVMDNYGTHKTPAVKRWFVRHPEYRPALHPDQRVVAEPGGAVLRRRSPRSGSAAGSFRSVAELERAIEDYLAHAQREPQAVRVDHDADLILDKVKQVCRTPRPARETRNELLTQDTRSMRHFPGVSHAAQKSWGPSPAPAAGRAG